ncbi:MAG: hypothetical protein ACKO38_21550 [Planctomycetota bacterium]
MVRFSRRGFSVALRPRRGPAVRLLTASFTAGSALVALFLAGCQNGPRVNTYIEAMAAERRALEDRVYQLEYELDVAREELSREQGRRGGGVGGSGGARGGLNGGRGTPVDDRGGRRGAGSGSSGESGRPSRGAAPNANAEPEEGSKLGDDSMLKPPVIEPGEASTLAPLERPPASDELLPPKASDAALESTPPSTLPVLAEPAPLRTPSRAPSVANPPLLAPPDSPRATPQSAPSDSPQSQPPDMPQSVPPSTTGSATRPLGPPILAKRPSVKSAAATKASPRSASGAGMKGKTSSTRPASGKARVTSVALAPQPTGGVDLDDSPGDDGVTVALELRDERGKRVWQPGAISVVVLDLSQTGPSARVARWDLDQEQVEQLADMEDSRAAVVLHMAWPGEPPQREKLQLHVRYVADDGRKLEAYRDISIKLPSGSAARAGSVQQYSSRPAANHGGWRPKGLNLESPSKQAVADGSPASSPVRPASSTGRDSGRQEVVPASGRFPAE